jgi:hypothetical protein
MGVDQAFTGVAAAVGVQSAFGTVNATIRDLNATTATALTDGLVLGDAESGDAESGVTLPNIAGIYRAVARVAGSFTEQADSFSKADVTGFSISWVHQGNGSNNSFSTGDAEIDDTIPGLDAIFQSAGLSPADGANASVEYTPAATANVYTTWKLWHGNFEFVFSDCLVDTLKMEFTPGGKAVFTADVSVGTFDTTVDPNVDDFPGSINYGVMSSLTGPTVEGVDFGAFGTTRGFESLTVTIASTVEKFGDSNVDVSGERQSFTKREITVDGTLYVDDDDSAAAFDQLVSSSAPTNDLTFQVGTAVTQATTTETYNAFSIAVNNLQPKDIKYNRVGTTLVVELSGAKATGTAAGNEFALTQN